MALDYGLLISVGSPENPDCSILHQIVVVRCIADSGALDCIVHGPQKSRNDTKLWMASMHYMRAKVEDKARLSWGKLKV